jgi:hypothetical protein
MIGFIAQQCHCTTIATVQSLLPSFLFVLGASAFAQAADKMAEFPADAVLVTPKSFAQDAPGRTWTYQMLAMACSGLQ